MATTGPQNGSLIIHGGGDISSCIDIFVKSAGGLDSTLVYIPTAFSDDMLAGPRNGDLDPVQAGKRFGFKKTHVLHTRDKKEADTEEFIQPIKEASAVWITGGRQWRLADSYLNTKTQEELNNLLERGGVIAGSSAGATIQGSFLIRGNSDPDNPTIILGDHQVGFGFISDVVIDQHVLKRNRMFDLKQVLANHPELLGVGIDNNTSIFVRKNEFLVVGNSYVSIFDGNIFNEKNETITLPPESEQFYLLSHGMRYNMEARRVVF
jgi:cyanophycinase